MANKNTTGIAKSSHQSANESERQIPFNVDENPGRPEPTTHEKPDPAEVGAPQNRRAFGLGTEQLTLDRS